MTDPPQTARTRAPLSDFLFAALAFPLAMRIAWQWRNIESDDNLIPLRYVRNLLDGRGWVYNVGEHVNATTSALNTILMTLAAILTGGDPIAAAAIVFALGLAAAAFFTYLTFKSSGLAPAWFAGGLVLFINLLPGSVGLEMSVYLGLVAATLHVYSTGRHRSAAALLGLVFLARPDGLLLWVLVFADFLWMHRRDLRARLRILLQCAAIAIGMTLPWLVFSKLYFGSFLPNTVGIKIAQGHSDFWGKGAIYFQGIGKWIPYLALNPAKWYGWPVYAAFACAGAVSTLAWSRRRLLWLAWPAGFTAAYCVLDVPPYHWYYNPLHFGILVMVAAGFARVWELTAREGNPRFRLGFRAMLALYALALIQPVFPDLFKVIPPQWPHYRAAARWLVEHSPPDASIACAEIGVLGYHTGTRTIVDINGLVTPGGRARIAAGDFTWWYETRKPDYAVFHEPAWPAEHAVAHTGDFKARYEAAHTIDEFKGMNLVIYRRRD